jgi:hypothetical protein
MPQTIKPTHTQPGGFVEDTEATETEVSDTEVVNDSLGKVDIADSTGIDEEKETGDAKVGNFNTRED